MLNAIEHLHDATLASIHFEWKTRTCELAFAGAPSFPGAFVLVFTEVAELSASSSHLWGPSVSVLEAALFSENRYTFTMQSGDSITVVAPNYSFKWKTTAMGAS